jgi:hypothetical protein
MAWGIAQSLQAAIGAAAWLTRPSSVSAAQRSPAQIAPTSAGRQADHADVAGGGGVGADQADDVGAAGDDAQHPALAGEDPGAADGGAVAAAKVRGAVDSAADQGPIGQPEAAIVLTPSEGPPAGGRPEGRQRHSGQTFVVPT